MAQKPSIPKGTRDFGQIEMAERNYIFDTIRSVFRKFGYSQIETPAMENLSTLMGKYGEEGDKLLFRILNSGDAFAGVDMTRPLTSQVCEKGLRYDLTVPFARYVVQHQSEISFPFKRFQIQPVWRADRPQKGRYREFYQCDVDVIGSKSQLLELELVQIADEVFRRLDINVLIKINNRKVLSGLAEICGAHDKVVDITVAIDKLDKIGLEAVEAEMIEKGLTPEAVKLLEPVLTLSGSNEQKIASMRSLMAESQIGQKGLDELEELFGYIKAVFEIKALDWQIGSISGGGRYDNLTGIFGLPDMSGVGISFGADRIYDVLKGLNKFPESLGGASDLLFANMGAAETAYVLPVASGLRSEGLSVEIYPESVKLKKQFDYADRKRIGFLSICGENEMAAGTIQIKNLRTGDQQSFDKGDIASMKAFIKA